MAKHDAVERLMTMATEKRADRLPDLPSGAAGVPGAASGVPGAAADLEHLDSAIQVASGMAGEPSQDSEENQALRPVSVAHKSKVADKGLQFLQAVRPLLPAAAAAMRLVDHGAVQAVARLLPLLGGTVGPSRAAQNAAAEIAAEQEQFLQGVLELDVKQQAMRKEVQALTLQNAVQEDELRRLRSQLERVTAEQLATAQDSRRLADRVRLVTAVTIILVMLLISQMILVVILFHK